MRYQIVSDSSSNVFHLEGVSYTTVPMKIIMGENISEGSSCGLCEFRFLRNSRRERAPALHCEERCERCIL